MKRRGIMIAMCIAVTTNAINAQIAEKLEKIGMENIKSLSLCDGFVTAYEDRVYRNSYEGVGKVVETVLEGNEAGNIRLVILDKNGIPQLKITLEEELVRRYRNGECTLKEVYATMGLDTNADEELMLLKGVRTENRSRWKPDLVVYPQLFLENTSFDKLYRYYISLAPAIEMPLWKGAELTAQAIFPIVGNQQGELKTIRPGIVAISQGFYLKKNWYIQAVAGQFTDHRLGGQVTGMWRNADGRWELGAKAGVTIYSIFDNQGWTITNKPKVNASIYARTYIPVWNTEVTAEASRYVYGDYGIQGDVTRHFGEYTIGLYGMYTGGKVNGGFTFAIPLPGRKYKRWKGMRIKPADYFSYKYGMVAWGEYKDRNLGFTYNTVPGENRSKGFYQPNYIRYYLIKDTKINQKEKNN